MVPSEPEQQGISGQQESQGQGGNPAWQEFLDVVPQELHHQVTPLLEKWDKGVQDRFQKVHSTYEPWKPLVDAGVDPEHASFGVQFLDYLQENPQDAYNMIGEYYGISAKQAQELVEQGQDGEPNEEDPYDSRFTEIERQNKIMAEVLLDNQNRESEMQAEAELDTEFNQLYQKYGRFDESTENIILGLMSSGMSSEDAAQTYFSNLERAAGARTPKPLIMGSGGGAPGQGVDVKKLDEKGTKNLIVQYLQAARDQG